MQFESVSSCPNGSYRARAVMDPRTSNSDWHADLAAALGKYGNFEWQVVPGKSPEIFALVHGRDMEELEAVGKQRQADLVALLDKAQETKKILEALLYTNRNLIENAVKTGDQARERQ